MTQYNFKIMNFLKTKSKMSIRKSSLDEQKSRKRLINERNLAIKMIIYISNLTIKVLNKFLLEYIHFIYIKVIFLVCWTPYAVVALYSAFINEQGVKPLLGTLPALFAKSSTVWSSMFYLFLNKKIRKKLFCNKKSSTKTVNNHKYSLSASK